VIRPALILALCAASAVTAFAQEPQSAPAEPRQPRGGEVRFGYLMQSLRRNSALEGSGTATGSGTIAGFEFLAQTDGLGVMARRSTGSTDGTGHGLEGDFISQEVRLMIGGRIFSVEGGVLERTGSHLNEETKVVVWRGGARSQWNLGGSGLVVKLGVGLLFSRLDTEGSAQFKGRGHDLDAMLLYQAPEGLPLYVLVGWHHERFDDLESTAPRWEEGSGPYLGIGVRLAPRLILR